MMKKSNIALAQSRRDYNFAPMAHVAQQQFSMSLLVLAIASMAFIMLNVFHFIVA